MKNTAKEKPKIDKKIVVSNYKEGDYGKLVDFLEHDVPKIKTKARPTLRKK